MRLIDAYRFGSVVADASFIFDASSSNYLESSGDFINGNVNIPGVHTWSWWIKIAAPAVSQFLFEHYQNNNNRYYVEFTNAPLLALRFRGLGVNNQATCSANIYDNDWHHVLLVVSNNFLTNPPRIFIDGTEEVITPTAVGNITAINSSTLQFGRSKRTSSDYLDGKLSQFAFWDSDQSANVADIYNGGTPADLGSLATPPDAYWQFDTADDLETANGVTDRIGAQDLTGNNMTNASNIDTIDFP